ncbi:hypothetical protein ACT8ZV_16200 [Nocardioides sp. MAHUQ-72]|uniref:hypothetical protein n=1 Tax=unclassified Nocardioides TaxID=2615069 RepID=UPI0036086B14
MRSVPEALRAGPFTRPEALAAGVTPRMLDGKRFVRIHQKVWRHRDHEMTEADWVEAARLALPDSAYLTGLSRLQQLGLDFGPRRPLHFVVEGDHHLAIDGVFLHRTKQLAPTDEVGVNPAGAFIAYVARARVIDAIKVGDWLLHHGYMTIDDLHTLALSALWRDGAHEAVWILDYLDERSRSLKESEMRAVLEFSDLPAPDVNVPVPVGEDVTVIGDLVYTRWRTVVEYEGAQHQEDREQYVADLGRYALMRGAQVTYVQVTREKLARARTTVGEVFRALVANGYDGPPPVFGEKWRLLFAQVSDAVGPKNRRAAS